MKYSLPTPGILSSKMYIVFLMSCFSACSQEAPETVVETIRPALLIDVSATSNIRKLNFPAVITARASSALTFSVSGTLDEFPIREGQIIEIGDLIARLDQAEFQNTLDTAQAQFDNAQGEFSRAETLIQESAISRSVYEQRKTDRDVARATLDNARKNLEDSVIRAPFSGIIASKDASQFQTVNPQSAIVTLQSTGAAEAQIQLPSTFIANAGSIEPIETIVVLDVAPDLRIPGTYLSIATTTDVRTQTFAVNFLFSPPDDLNILPGMTATVNFTVADVSDGERVEQIRIPTNAILTEAGVRYVWLVDTDAMTVSKRELTVSTAIGEELVILNGLAEGDVIVGAGGAYLFEGMKISAYQE